MKKYEVFEISNGMMGEFKTLMDRFGEDLKKYYKGVKQSLATMPESEDANEVIENVVQNYEDLMPYVTKAIEWCTLSCIATFEAAGYIKLPEHVKYVQEVLDGTREFHSEDDECMNIFLYMEKVWEETGDENLAKWVSPEAKSEFTLALMRLAQ